MQESKQLRFFVTVLNIFFVILALWLVFRYLFPWCLPFLIAMGIATLIERPVSFLERQLRFPRALASLIFTLLTFCAFGGALWFICTKIIVEIRELLETLPDTQTMLLDAARVLRRITGYLPRSVGDVLFSLFEGIVTEGIRIPQGVLNLLGKLAKSVATSLPSLLFSSLIALIATYFFSADKEQLLALFHELIPQKAKRLCSQTKREGLRIAGGYLRSAGILFSLVFALLSVGLGVLRVEFAVGSAFLIALLDALPIFGVGAALIPWGFACLLSGEVSGAIGLFVLYGIVLITRNLIEPKILGAQIGLHPLVTLFSFYIGIHAFGPLGIFLPIPVGIALGILRAKKHCG